MTRNIMNDSQIEVHDDVIGRQNIEGDRATFKGNQGKIAYVLRKTKKFYRQVDSICDIGIGDAFALNYFFERGVKTTGIDISEYLVNHFKKKYLNEKKDIELLHADIAHSKIGENKYDCVTCFDVLEHIPGEVKDKAIQNIAESLKPEGVLIGTLPFRERLEDVMVVCPQCRHKFHPIGHYHSFENVDSIKEFLLPKFDIIKYGETPLIFLKSGFFTVPANFIFKHGRRIISNKQKSTIYFVAKVLL